MIAPAPLVAYASSLAGHPVEVKCQRDQSFKPGMQGYTLYRDSDGVIDFDQIIYLPTSTCQRLIRIIDRRTILKSPKAAIPATIVSPGTPGTSNEDLYDGAALEVILHESLHLRENSADEARVECDAFLNRWQAVAPLKLPARRARMILEGMKADHQSSARTPVDYLADC